MDETEDISVVVDGRVLASVVINHNKGQACKSAYAAASHISTPDNIQLCPFSDGSHGPDDNRGGVGLAYSYPWLPPEWVTGPEATYPSYYMVRKAWPFGHASGSLAMEGVGVLESLCAANEELKRHLPVLAKHASTVNVRATTDCQWILRNISTGPMSTNQARTLPPQLIKKIHDLILALQGHGIKVIVELHWCPRNTAPPLSAADAMAGQAMRNGLGFCNVTNNLWSRATRSLIMEELEPMLAGTIRFARLPVIHSSTGAGSTGASEETTKNTRRRKKEARRIQVAETTPSGAAESHPQFPLPAAPVPSKPATTSNAEATTSNAGKATFTAGASTIPSTESTSKALASVPPPKESAKVQGGKRKAEEAEMEQRVDGHTKKSKVSPARPSQQHQQQQPLTMPAAWGLNPKTKMCILNLKTGKFTKQPVPQAEFIRMIPDSTKETGEKNLFINDGVNLFSVAVPIGITLPPM